MRIRYQSSGGLAYMPGLQKPVEIDTDELDAATRDRLAALVEAAGFFKLPATLGAPARGADRQTETLGISQQGQEHSVHLHAPPEGAMRELLQAIRQLVHDRRAAALAARAAPPKPGPQ